MNFKCAIRAFLTILNDRDHIYSDSKVNSIYGNRQFVSGSLDSVAEMFNDGANQLNALSEAKEILNQIK